MRIGTGERPMFPLTGRSRVLLGFGLISTLIGLLYLLRVPSKSLNDAIGVILDRVPLPFWGLAFVASGIYAIICALFRWHKNSGFAVLQFLYTIWAGAYLAGWLVGDASGSVLVYALVFGLLCYIINAVAGMEG